MHLYSDATGLVGHTPVVRVNKLVPDGAAEVYLKLEAFNPGGSVKDRPALNMIRAAEREGILNPGSVIVEPTSGNTGIGLAMVAAVRGYHMVICMPAGASAERVQLMQAFGAEVVLTPEDQGMKGAIAEAERFVGRTDNAWMPQQFENPNNPEAHRTTTAIEILDDFEGRLDAFVATSGTGGTITGTGEALRQKLPELLIVVVEPTASPVLSGGDAGKHHIPGMGPGFIPDVLNQDVYDRITQVTDEQAREMTRRLAREEGLLVGPSSGAAVVAALRVAAELGPGKRVLALAPDRGERYLSTQVWSTTPG